MGTTTLSDQIAIVVGRSECDVEFLWGVGGQRFMVQVFFFFAGKVKEK